MFTRFSKLFDPIQFKPLKRTRKDERLISFKCHSWNDEIRRFSIQSEILAYSILYDKVKTLFSINMDFIISYKDQDGDPVLISSDQELLNAIRDLPENATLKIYLKPELKKEEKTIVQTVKQKSILKPKKKIDFIDLVESESSDSDDLMDDILENRKKRKRKLNENVMNSSFKKIKIENQETSNENIPSPQLPLLTNTEQNVETNKILKQLSEMGFTDVQKNLQAISKYKDVERIVHSLLE